MYDLRPPSAFDPGAAVALFAATALLVAACSTGYDARRGPLRGISAAWTPQTCRAVLIDRDGDGLDDACELALAQAFAPELMVDRRDCSWDGRQESGRLAGGYLFAVQGASAPATLRIAYLPAYFRDCGWQGRPCALRSAGCSAHAGDSEIIVIDASFDAPTRRWLAAAVFLSAHCLGRADGRCRWYERDELRYFSWAGGVHQGAPRVWVAKGKHANYPSARECDTGHWYYDSCDGNDARYRFPIASTMQNIGSRRMPLPRGDSIPAGCIRADALPLRRSADPECFWTPEANFRGWQQAADDAGASAYATVLRHAAGF
jgi:hypothetical protein